MSDIQELQELCAEYKRLDEIAKDFDKKKTATNKDKQKIAAAIIKKTKEAGLESVKVKGVGTFTPSTRMAYSMVDKNAVLAAIKELDEATFEGLITINSNTFQSFMKELAESVDEEANKMYEELISQGSIHFSQFEKLSVRKA